MRRRRNHDGRSTKCIRLEACFQTLLLAFTTLRDISLWTAFTPKKIGRLTLIPNSCVGLNTPASVTVDTHLRIYCRVRSSVTHDQWRRKCLQFKDWRVTDTPRKCHNEPRNSLYREARQTAVLEKDMAPRHSLGGTRASSINLVQALCQELENSMGSYTIADASDRATEDMRRGMISDDLAISS
jgi:hypothetical protein